MWIADVADDVFRANVAFCLCGYWRGVMTSSDDVSRCSSACGWRVLLLQVQGTDGKNPRGAWERVHSRMRTRFLCVIDQRMTRPIHRHVWPVDEVHMRKWWQRVGEWVGDSVCVWRCVRLPMVAGLLGFSHRWLWSTFVVLVLSSETWICTDLIS